MTGMPPSTEGNATPRIAAILVNWRAPAMTLTAVERALEQSLSPDLLYVVDNGSSDGSVDMLRPALSAFGEQVALLENPHNEGFGSGCNLALRQALEAGVDYVWLLNNDAVPAPDCLSRLAAAAAAAPVPVGIVGSLLVDPTGVTPAHFGSWLNPVTLTCGALAPELTHSHRLGWMTAASMLVSVAALRSAGVFDPRFFMYWEDADLNIRIREAGFSIIGAADAIVEHHAGTSSSDIPTQRYLWHFASQDRFLRKHHPIPLAARAALRGKYLLKALIDRDLRRFEALVRASLAIAWKAPL